MNESCTNRATLFTELSRPMRDTDRICSWDYNSVEESCTTVVTLFWQKLREPCATQDRICSWDYNFVEESYVTLVTLFRQNLRGPSRHLVRICSWDYNMMCRLFGIPTTCPHFRGTYNPFTPSGFYSRSTILSPLRGSLQKS